MMDLHTHSYYSDGTDSPYDIILKAKQAGIKLCAVSDHDCMDGINEALEAGKALGVEVVPAVEIDVEADKETHLLAYGIDICDSELKAIFARQEDRRQNRNEKILMALKSHGINIEPKRDPRGKLMSRSHLAKALVDGGYANSMQESFKLFLGEHGIARIDLEKITINEFMSLVKRMNAKSVLAHPGYLGDRDKEIIKNLIDKGLDGIEAYYPSHTAAQIALYKKIANENNLLITCGSDYHGGIRKNVDVGMISDFAQNDSAIVKSGQILRMLYCR